MTKKQDKADRQSIERAAAKARTAAQEAWEEAKKDIARHDAEFDEKHGGGSS